MSAPGVLGASVLAGCGVLLVQHVRKDAQEQQNIREMTAHLMGVKRAYADTVAAMTRAAHRQDRLLSAGPELQTAASFHTSYAPDHVASSS